MFDSSTNAASETPQFAEFANSGVYVAKACSPSRIDFDYDVYAFLSAPEDERDYATFDAKRQAARKAAEVELKGPLPVPTGHLDIEPASGRPAHLSRSDEIPSTEQMQAARAMAAKMTPGLEIPDITSIVLDFTFTYDPSIKIEAPK